MRSTLPATAAAGVAIVLLGAGLEADARAQGTSLRFYGAGVNDIDRVKIRIDDPGESADVGPPVDVGLTDFTIEFRVKGFLADNTGTVPCGSGNGWINGNILIDRDRFNQGRNYGISFGNGRPAFGVMDEFGTAETLCGSSLVLDGQWHHVAVQRNASDGWMQVWVDGVLEAETDGPDGDISYPDDGVPGNYCGGPCVNSDPFVVFGAEKHDAGPSYPSFAGWMDEVRYSTVLRYSAAFTPPSAPFAPDADTAALYHLDEGTGNVVGDASGAPGGPSDGTRQFGGTPPGPEWSTDTPFGGAVAAPFAGERGPGIRVWPNPARGAVTLSLGAEADGSGAVPRLAVHDVSGRRVADLSGARSGGRILYRWMPDEAALPAGRYFARVGTGGPTLTATITLVR